MGWASFVDETDEVQLLCDSKVVEPLSDSKATMYALESGPGKWLNQASMPMT